jgi:excisionase family DNA binding protein
MIKPADSRDFLSPLEFVISSGLSISTVRRLLKAGRLPFIQPAGRRSRILIPRDALTQTRASPPVATPAGDRTPIRQGLPGPAPRWQTPQFRHPS